ncbi:hypothetical protein Poli38472_014091 [Pythium oligandrum]|uniref:Beta-catenin-like protein 1 N-terminal domain-containing protein n=1 Tax=Pythium oligandrum TaxID=41045 RepID=A0A8K1FMZ1_PYTOL|nr:hypothetical protein Poli38472_014091 [Pythium oligandrum]|eukprot:TMW66779.1 hypothetical protein Poli38472_014091 [Pythium oligandrum]
MLTTLSEQDGGNMDAHFERVLAHSTRPEADSPRKRRADGERENGGSSKRSRGAGASLSREKIAEMLAQADASAVEDLDARALKSMAHALDKAIRKNALMRGKYADDPTKFMDSEVQLDEELSKWKAVAASPALYTELLALDVVPKLLGLFTHENLDIRLDVIHLLADLTDVDEDPTALPPTTALAEHLVTHEFLPLLVKTLEDLDRDTPKDAQVSVDGDGEQDPNSAGVFHALQSLENLVDLLPSASVTLCQKTEIFALLLRLTAPKREFTANKLYASEILSILLQADRQNRQRFLEKQSSKSEPRLDRLLQALAPFRKRDPRDEDEEEFVENLLNAICSLLMERDGQDQFRRLEGLELMLRCMKDRKQYVFSGALRVLDHAVMNHPRNCERIVEIGGLKTVFPVFMGKKSAKKKPAERAKEVENVTSVLASLCLWLENDAPHDVHARFHAKFMESDMEKMDRLVDLFVKYHERVAAAARGDQDEDDEEDDEDERYLRRLDAGLFVLQRIAMVLAHLSELSKKLRAYVLVKCHERNVDVDAVSQVLQEQLVMLSAEATEQEEQKQEEDVNEDEQTRRRASEKQRARLTTLVGVFDEKEASVGPTGEENGEAPEASTE